MNKAAVLKGYKKLFPKANWSFIASRLGLTRQAVSKWQDPIPELAARKIHDDTEGAVKFNPKVYAK